MVTSLATKRISAISQWQTFLKSFNHKTAAKGSLHQNYVTVTLCINHRSITGNKTRSNRYRDHRKMAAGK